MRPFFSSGNEETMSKSKYLSQGAIFAALYVGLSYLQNMLLPGSASWAIQCRVAEALCVFAFFTPAAIYGLSIGCLLFNLSYSMALPLDPVVGTLATALATWCMWKLRNFRLLGPPWLGLLMPALWNALLVGWELTVYIGGGFWLNALYVAIGEGIALFVPGLVLYRVLVTNKTLIRLLKETLGGNP